MEKSQCSFNQLPFSSLFSTYIYDHTEIQEYFSANPFNDDEIRQRIEKIPTYSNRQSVVTALKVYHEQLGIADQQISQIAKFADPQTLVMVTGQQLGIYGGPLYTIYKTITTILLAAEWEKKLNRPVVPVFWLADEDHDFEEIASVGILGNEGKKSIKLEEQGSGISVSDEILTDAVSALNEVLKTDLHETDFSSDLWIELQSCYQSGRTHGSAFAKLMASWFSKHGILIAGSNHKELKSLLADTFKTSVEKADDIHDALELQSSNLEQNFHRQVVVGDTNIFLLSENGRSKFHRDGDNWIADGLTFTKEKLLSIIESTPEKISPNVFLRPVIQDVLLPTIGYVAGPGELAYFAQMKTYYKQFGMEMPIIFPRLSATLLETGVDRIIEKLPFDMCSYNQRIEKLEAQYIAMNSSTNVDALFGKWTSELKNISGDPILQIQQIDPTLKGMAEKTITGFDNELNKLKGRVIRSMKQQEETQLKRIARIKSQLFPDGMQERAINPIYFMNKYGLDIWDKVLSDFSEKSLDLTTHHVIKM